MGKRHLTMHEDLVDISQPQMMRNYGDDAFAQRKVDYDADMALPVETGSARWTTFRCEFVRYMVVKEDELVGTENPKFIVRCRIDERSRLSQRQVQILTPTKWTNQRT